MSALLNVLKLEISAYIEACILTSRLVFLIMNIVSMLYIIPYTVKKVLKFNVLLSYTRISNVMHF